MKQCLAGLFAVLLLAGCGNNNADIIEASGTIEGTQVNLGTEVAGRVRDVRVEEGERVKRGDTLLVIDDTEYRIQLRQAIANEESFEYAYRLAVDGARKEDIVQARATYVAAESDYKRMQELLASKTVTQKQYDDTFTRFVAAEQTYRKLRSGSRPEEIAAARGRRDQAAAQADLLRKRIRDCHLVAPVAGIVTLRSVEPGELVGYGSSVLQLTDLDTVKLTIYLKETEVARISVGQTAQITIDAFGEGRAFEGRVAYISPTAEFTPKNVQTKEERTKLVFAVKVRVPNQGGVLKPGLPADAQITVPTAVTRMDP